jgi:hypothetical protein
LIRGVGHWVDGQPPNFQNEANLARAALRLSDKQVNIDQRA